MTLIFVYGDWDELQVWVRPPGIFNLLIEIWTKAHTYGEVVSYIGDQTEPYVNRIILFKSRIGGEMIIYIKKK